MHGHLAAFEPLLNPLGPLQDGLGAVWMQRAGYSNFLRPIEPPQGICAIYRSSDGISSAILEESLPAETGPARRSRRPGPGGADRATRSLVGPQDEFRHSNL